MFAAIAWIVFGYVAGWLVFKFFPAPQPVNALQITGVGIAGSIVGGIVHAAVTGSSYAPAGFIVSLAGAVAVTAAWRWYLEGKQ